MHINKGFYYLFATFIFLITNAALICGLEGEEVDEHLNDGLEEVSIEAVEEEDHQSSLQNRPSSHAGKADKYSFESSSNMERPEGISDNSTAIATVYPDIRGNTNNISTTLTNGTNTVNATNSRLLRVKVSCLELYSSSDSNSTLNETGAVEIVNMTYLLHGILVTNPAIKTRTMPSNCTVVLFYTHWCPWSAKAAPHFNALPRAFRNIRFAAIDSSVYTAVNTYFGILSVPTIVLFYNGKLQAKYNESTFNVNHFGDFITTFTDQKPAIRLNVTSQDFLGPIPSMITKGPDWYLYLSWVFIVACFVYYVTRTTFWHRVLELIQNSWREAEAVASVPRSPPGPNHHFHQD